MLKVLIADDHALLAESLYMILDKEEDIKVVGIAQDGENAIKKCLELTPDAVLLDIKMPKLDGIEAAKAIKESCPNTKVIILTSLEDGKCVLNSLTAGADGYILKDTPPQKLKTLIQCICWGYYIASDTARQLFMDELSNNGNMAHRHKNGLLRDEDIEIVKLISEGKSNAEIADTLKFAEGTIRNKIAKIISTVGVDSRVNLVMYTLKNNLL